MPGERPKTADTHVRRSFRDVLSAGDRPDCSRTGSIFF